MQWGTEEQKRRFVTKIVSGDEIWCQGYSEPNSGSDLASLHTRAVEDGDYFRINGQKIWTSQAQYADWAFVLCRTDPNAPKHRGISYLLVDMKTPGITVRPLVQMSGATGFNEVFFDDVRTPKKFLVGEKNHGWLRDDRQPIVGLFDASPSEDFSSSLKCLWSFASFGAMTNWQYGAALLLRKYSRW
jgi:alkylation response protein AidB-like acyl-CoA dehydrogenase